MQALVRNQNKRNEEKIKELTESITAVHNGWSVFSGNAIFAGEDHDLVQTAATGSLYFWRTAAALTEYDLYKYLEYKKSLCEKMAFAAIFIPRENT